MMRLGNGLGKGCVRCVWMGRVWREIRRNGCGEGVAGVVSGGLVR